MDGCGLHNGEDLLVRLRNAAAAEERGASLAPSVRRALVLLPPDNSPLTTCYWLVAVAEANLPVARLVEGHLNACLLLDRLAPGTADPRAVYGVWGADGAAPLHLDGELLAGGKRFASGLGTVTDAVVTVAVDGATRLARVNVTDATRHDSGTWRMSGMRATVSGDIDLTGLCPEWIGRPDAYFAEPTFLGGVWRIAALQVGGTLGLLGAARDVLAARGHLEADAQVARLAPLTARAFAAFGLVERAATIASGPQGIADPDRAVALSIQARLLTEDLAQDAVAAVERSVGLGHFAEGSDTGRIARDLATYCRQVARDAFEQKAGRIVLGRPGRLSDFWHG